MSGSDSEDDWFSKDEKTLVESLERSIACRHGQDVGEEYIDCHASSTSAYLQQLNLSASEAVFGPDTKPTRPYTNADFKNALKLEPIDLFLYFMTGRRNFFVDQLKPIDSQERVAQYVTIFATLCQLELAGFDDQFMSAFAKQTVLVEQLKRFFTKLFSLPLAYWDTESKMLFANSKWLLMRAYKLGVLSEEGLDLLRLLLKLFAQCKTPLILQDELCVDLAKELEECGDLEHYVTLSGAASIKHQLYSSIELLWSKTEDVETHLSPDPKDLLPGDIVGYIKRQRKLICEDFMLPFHEFIHRMRIDSKDLEEQGLLFPNTKILLNPYYQSAHRHNLLFAKLYCKIKLDSTESEELTRHQRKFVDNLKTGALLCFTGSSDFDNLILASVNFSEVEKKNEGYVGIEIVRQYNIGNIYDKPFIMFEAPVFFEPYLRVHNYLSTCSIEKFPMSCYIVDGMLETHPPAYLQNTCQLKYNGQSFTLDTMSMQLPLNKSQQAAFKSVLSNDFCLIQGPPGTGKTHLSVQLVKTLVENAKNLNTGPIVVLTYTNESLDKFLLKVLQYTDNILRFGSQSRHPVIQKYNQHSVIDRSKVPANLNRVFALVNKEHNFCFEQLQILHKSFDGSEDAYQQILKAQQKLQVVVDKLNTLRTVAQYYVARDKAIIAMTTTCAARLNYLLRLLKSKVVIFEEAGEIQEAHVCACLTPYVNHVIMIGDHKQLQPYTGSRVNHGLQISLFERLISQNFPLNILYVQYRMHSSIGALLVPTFYDQLLCDDSVLQYKDISKVEKNLYFLTHNNPERKYKEILSTSQLCNAQSDMSFINEFEVIEIVKLAEHLLTRSEVKDTDIVILSPYKAQVDCIKRKLPNLKVSTVDSFQGLESNIVLLSLVRNNSSGNIGFLRQGNRVCVALSRARWALYMIGNMQTLLDGNPSVWFPIEQKLRKNNCIGPKFPLLE